MAAVNRLLAVKLSDVDQYLIDLDVEFFYNKGIIIVVLDYDAQAKQIVNELKEPFKLRVDSPDVLTRPTFAVKGDVVVQKVGKSLRIFKD